MWVLEINPGCQTWWQAGPFTHRTISMALEEVSKSEAVDSLSLTLSANHLLSKTQVHAVQVIWRMFLRFSPHTHPARIQSRFQHCFLLSFQTVSNVLRHICPMISAFRMLSVWICLSVKSYWCLTCLSVSSFNKLEVSTRDSVKFTLISDLQIAALLFCIVFGLHCI